ncbi:hypothetical protein FHS18_002765 [Paenibacillus phyllosphaerae]|uniref:Uncharacterized protein n=1 Tax=Paenibacillus phyllosphaerae TaxID=274593 RepID=A0A7W5FN10_9BACL|nr:hypothetical protein [Paenibacillus phyllosphaerae]
MSTKWTSSEGQQVSSFIPDCIRSPPQGINVANEVRTRSFVQGGLSANQAPSPRDKSGSPHERTNRRRPRLVSSPLRASRGQLPSGSPPMEGEGGGEQKGFKGAALNLTAGGKGGSPTRCLLRRVVRAAALLSLLRRARRGIADCFWEIPTGY